MAEETRKNTNTNTPTRESGQRGTPDGGRGDAEQDRSNPAQNLSQQDKARGGQRSAEVQGRDEEGQFTGRDTEDARDRDGEEDDERSGTNARRGQGNAGGNAGPGNPNDSDRNRSGGGR